MKKSISMLMALVMCLLLMSGCCLSHEWIDADCTHPKLCAKCEKTEGEALDHNWVEANCVAPKTCSQCDATEGTALGHQWGEATMAEPSKCTICEAVNPDECSIAAKLIEGTWEICYANIMGEIYSKENPLLKEITIGIDFAFATDGTAYLIIEGEEPFPVPWQFVEESEGKLSYVLSDGVDVVNIWYYNSPDSPSYQKLELDMNDMGSEMILDGPNYVLCEKISSTAEIGSEIVEEPEDDSDDSTTIVIELPELHTVDATDNPLFPEMVRLMGIDDLKEHISIVRSYEEKLQVRLDNADYIEQAYTFEMGNGSNLQLPMTYGELLKAGWKVAEELVYRDGKLVHEYLCDPLPAETYINCTFINRSGKKIDVNVANAYPEAVRLNDAWITQLNVGVENGETYSVNGITAGSTVDEILAEFGIPYDIAYYQLWSGDYRLMFYYMNEEKNCYLQFYIDPETEQLFQIYYLVLPDTENGEE